MSRSGAGGGLVSPDPCSSLAKGRAARRSGGSRIAGKIARDRDAPDVNDARGVGGVVTHVNLNDDTLEGFVHQHQAVVAIQYHPEASPGPHDGSYMFARLMDAVAKHKSHDLGVLV